MARKITFEEFKRMLEDPEVPDSEIRKYLRAAPESSGAFAPQFQPDPEKVEADPFESALTIGNSLSRWRRRRRFQRRQNRGDNRPVIVSEGDSWFQFPLIIDDVIDHLEDDFLVWSSGAAGDTAQNMIFDNPEYMEALDEQADQVRAFLLSAAGNDVIGEDANGEPVLRSLLHRRRPDRNQAHQLINRAALGRVLDKLRDGYQRVIQDIRNDDRFLKLPILIHGYDYALPYPVSRADPRRPFWADRDEWLGSAFKSKDIDDRQVRRQIIEILINELYQLLDEIAANDADVHVIDVRNTLTKVTDWADEIHGTSDGFRRVARKFRETLNRVIVPAAFEMAEDFQPIEPPIDRETDYPAIDGPSLIIEARPDLAPVSERVMGFGDEGRFARGWSRARRLEIAVGEDDSLPYWFLKEGVSAGQAVCKIEASGIDYRGFGPGRWSGTGFLVAPNILLTNYHVLNSEAVARSARAIFGFEEDRSGEAPSSESYLLNPDRLFIVSPENQLDYCFVWIEGSLKDRFSQIEFWRGSFMASPEEEANIIHHPDGQPKRVSIRENEIIDLGAPETLVHYASDTMAGSSGSPVLNSECRLFALHHASTAGTGPDIAERVRQAGFEGGVLNEGIKTSAIAVDIETRAKSGPDASAAGIVLQEIKGTDSRTGFFGALGRPGSSSDDGLERVVDSYRGAPTDVDVAFWNIEWFNRHYAEKLQDVARIIVDLNLDIWALEESSPEATEALVKKLRDDFGQHFDFAASEPDASSGKQTTTVIWNTQTVAGERLEWPAEVDRLLRLHSLDSEAQRFEAVEGKIFNRYPGLFRFEALNRGTNRAPFDFNLVPLHLKAKAEGARRRRMASNILAEAVAITMDEGREEKDWIIGGDLNAELSTGQFRGLSDAGFIPLSAKDEAEGAITYLSGPKSLIDSIFLSPDMHKTVDEDDFMIIAPDRADSGFVDRISDHRPVLVRLSLADAPLSDSPRSGRLSRPRSDDERSRLLREFLADLREDPREVLRALTELIRNS